MWRLGGVDEYPPGVVLDEERRDVGPDVDSLPLSIVVLAAGSLVLLDVPVTVDALAVGVRLLVGQPDVPADAVDLGPAGRDGADPLRGRVPEELADPPPLCAVVDGRQADEEAEPEKVHRSRVPGVGVQREDGSRDGRDGRRDPSGTVRPVGGAGSVGRTVRSP